MLYIMTTISTFRGQTDRSRNWLCGLISKMASKLLNFLLRSIYPEGTTRLPAMIMTISFLLMTLNAMTTTALYSFLPKMVKSFGASEIGAGQYAGIVASSIYVGRLIFSSFWGYITDNKGKKLAIIASGVSLVFTTAAFAFSNRFYWATVTRFLQGCCMGLAIIVRVWLADICDETNMSLGMSMIITAYSVGLILGPCIGGFTAFPADQYPNVFSTTGIFARFGILLPTLVIDFFLAATVVLAIIYLPSDKNMGSEKERLLNSENKKSYGINEVVNSKLSNENINGSIKSFVVNGSPSKSLKLDLNGSLNTYHSSDANELNNVNHLKNGKVAICDHSYVPNTNQNSPYKRVEGEEGRSDSISFIMNVSIIAKFKKSKLYHVLTVKECVYGSLLYCWLSLNDIGFAEIFPLLVATDPYYNGMGFTTADIGSILMIVAVSVTILQVTISPRITDYFGPKKALMYSNLVLIFLYPILGELVAIKDQSILWVCLIVYRILVNAATFTAIVCVNILVNNSVSTDLLGSAYGLSMTLASVGRMVAPVFFGSIFSWSLTNIKGILGNEGALGFPFNQFFALYVHSICSLLAAIFAATLPDTMNAKKST